MQFMTKINLITGSIGIFARLNRYFKYNFSLPSLPLPDKVINFAGSTTDKKRFFDFFVTINKAFSLIEMLMALLVASLLMAALAPVMTRKMNEHIQISGTGAAIIPTGGCIVTEGLQEDFCEIPENIYSISAIIASGGGGGGGAAKMALSAVKNNYAAISGTSGSTGHNSSTYNITSNMQNVIIQLVGGGGGAGGGWSNEGGYPANQNDCGNWGVYVGPEYSGSAQTSSAYHSICVSQRNPEVNGGGAAPKVNISGVGYYPAGTKCPDSVAAGALCCWVGQTATEYNSANGGYSGSSRTNCQWNAAHYICSNWKPVATSGASTGRLVTAAEINGWSAGIAAGKLNKYHSGYGDSANYPGLNLCCDGNYGEAKCSMSANCIFSSAANCHSHVIWGNSPSPNVAVSGHFSGGGIGASTSYNASYPFGVRCVLDKISGFTSYTGGGGGAGLYAKVKIPNEVIRKATQNGGTASLKLMAGGGGTGSKMTNYASSSTAVTAVSGAYSRAELRNENGQLVWAFQVPGGKAGTSAVKTGNGAAGAQINRASNSTADGCRYLNTYSINASARTERVISCNSIPDSGVLLDTQAGGGASGGTGAKGYFDGTETAAASAAAETTGANGTRGGGGGAGYCTIGPTRLTPKCAQGGHGGGGMAHFTYQLFTSGAGGGGGGAGAVVHIKNINNGIKPGVKITMRAGAGGTGGQPGSSGGNGAKGADGESSYISYSTNGTNEIKYEVSGGKGGGGAVAGKPDTNQNPKSGTAGAQSSLDKAKLNSLVGSANYKYYPLDLSKTTGKSPEYRSGSHLQAGGNGGINSKISPYTSLPCGGLSEISIDYYGAKDVNEDNLKCNQVESNNINPLTLSLNEIVKQFQPNMAAAMSENNADNYAGEILPGGTGGGGGAWSWLENENEKASAGANGMKGYAIIYWNVQE